MLKITMNTANEAMQDRSEIARLLREIAENIENRYLDEGVIVDSNGNRVGTWEMEPLEEETVEEEEE